MENKNRVKNVVNYYLICNKLKSIIRSGWLKWNVSKERLESVAEHIFGVQSLAIAMYSEYEYNIDINKVLFMIAVHELEETIIGDLTVWDISPYEKMLKGHNAIEKILSGLLLEEEIKELIYEFDDRITNEAIFAYRCDKLECDLQCKIYDEENLVDLDNQEDNIVLYDKKIQDIIKKGNNTWSSICLEYDRDKFIGDKNFIEILDYIKNNNITKENKTKKKVKVTRVK